MFQISEFINEYGRETLETALGVFTAILLYKNRQHKTTVTGYPGLIRSQEQIIARMADEIEKLKGISNACDQKLFISYNDIEELNRKIVLLEAQLSKQYDNINAFKDFAEHIPTPVWMKYPNLSKDLFSKMCFINQAYETRWSISKASYQEKCDNDVWPDTICKIFSHHDYLVSKNAVSIISTELVPKIPFKPISDDNPAEKWVVWKFPVIINDSVCGVGGIAIEMHE